MAKKFSWSYSKVKNFVTCPKRHYEVDIAKTFTDDTEQLKWGNEVHDALAKALTGAAPLPDTMAEYNCWIERYAHPKLPGEIKVEQKFAITEQFVPCGWSDWNHAWYRGICDFMRIFGNVAIAVDWKTGKKKHDSRQLMLMAQCIFAHNPGLKRIHTEFVWLQDTDPANLDEAVTKEIFNRDTIVKEWPPVLALVHDMQEAARTMTYQPKPSNLCYKYCPVSSCVFHGKRNK